MKGASLVTKAFVTGAKCLEVLYRLWDSASVHTNFDATGLFAVNREIKKDRIGNFGILGAKKSLEESTNLQFRRRSSVRRQ